MNGIAERNNVRESYDTAYEPVIRSRQYEHRGYGYEEDIPNYNPGVQIQDDYRTLLWNKLNSTAVAGPTYTPSQYAPSQQYDQSVNASAPIAQQYAPSRQYNNNGYRAYNPTAERTYTNAPVEEMRTFEPVNYKYGQKAPAKAKKKSMSTQGKVVLAVYLMVVLLITALVIINAEVINGASQIAAPSEGVENPYVANADGLYFMEAPVANEVETNWFDNFCDAINAVLGD